MRGRSSSAKARLRSAGYKCNLCGRRVIDAATLERHRKTIHNVSPRDNRVSFKQRLPAQRRKSSNKEKEKIFDHLVKEEIHTVSKPKSRTSKNNYEGLRDTAVATLSGEGEIIGNKEIDLIENGKSVSVDKNDKSKKKDDADVTRRTEFECPVCSKLFNVYFNAHRHIQKAHSTVVDIKKVQPIRVEQCYRCDNKMRSNEHHVCPKIIEEHINVIAEYVCSGCNQIFVSLKSFDMHVAGLHSDAVDSMFFPTKVEFMTWSLEMERETNAKYSLYGEYESKKIYRCNYARNNGVMDKYTAYFCPSSMVVQEFSKGIQVHYYYKHYDHAANPYMLSSKYKKYSITSFLRSPNEDNSAPSVACSVKLDDKELFSRFKKLMDTIVINAGDADVSVLKKLIEKALEMSAVLTDAVVSETVPQFKSDKSMSDKEIAEALEMKTDVHKRRRSVDSCETPPKPAKRTRNKSLFTQSDTNMSPKILNTFSLASNSNSDQLKTDNGDEINFDLTKSDTNDKVESIQNKNAPVSDTADLITNKFSKMNTRLSNFNESLSFNDSYKDFIDKNFIAKTGSDSETKLTRNTVKTKLGAFKQTSPRKVENKEDITNSLPVNKKIGGMKPITSSRSKAQESHITKVNKIDMEKPKLDILSNEIPDVSITKVSSVKTDTNKEINAQTNNPKKDSKVNISKVKSRGAISDLIDPLQVIPKMNRRDSTPSVESLRRNSSKVNTRSISTPLIDPLELNISKVKTRNVTSSMEPSNRNIKKVYTRKTASPLEDPLKINTTKVNSSKIETKLNFSKIDPVKLNAPKVYHGPGTPKVSSPVLVKTSKVTPKVTFEEKVAHKVSFENKSVSTPSSTILTPRKKIKELKYEVREQENDCNILVLKL